PCDLKWKFKSWNQHHCEANSMARRLVFLAGDYFQIDTRIQNGNIDSEILRWRTRPGSQARLICK
ncbi:hypothetical protein, partial [Ralstonia pseudosolanacearum]|uniref:hypothetical protein n=1 Tax=Ralstonia pseudosolanacearum TaxID=1310165 RepID=UPI003AACA4C9